MGRSFRTLAWQCSIKAAPCERPGLGKWREGKEVGEQSVINSDLFFIFNLFLCSEVAEVSLEQPCMPNHHHRHRPLRIHRNAPINAHEMYLRQYLYCILYVLPSSCFSLASIYLDQACRARNGSGTTLTCTSWRAEGQD